MATIKNLVIRNLADGRALPITSIEGNVTIGELMSAYKGELKLPPEQSVSIKRKSTGKQLPSNTTIDGAGIQDNETLLIEMDIIPGAAN